MENRATPSVKESLNKQHIEQQLEQQLEQKLGQQFKQQLKQQIEIRNPWGKVVSDLKTFTNKGCNITAQKKKFVLGRILYY